MTQKTDVLSTPAHTGHGHEDREDLKALAKEILRQFPDDVRRLSKVDNTKGAWAITRQWIVISAAVAVAVWSEHWAVYILSAVVIATRQHALGIIVHDATHNSILTNRTLNDVVCDLFCAFPIGVTTNRYRYEHIPHHTDTNHEDDVYVKDFKADPANWHWPKTPTQAFGVLVRDLLAVNLPNMGKAVWRWSPWSNHLGRDTAPPPLSTIERSSLYCFLAAVAVALTLTGGWWVFLVLWLLPLLTITAALVRLRTIGEHLGIPEKQGFQATRHVDGALWERLSICPLYINYHILHHVVAKVPFYNLPELHEICMKSEKYRNFGQHKRAYFGTSSDCVFHDLVPSLYRKEHLVAAA